MDVQKEQLVAKYVSLRKSVADYVTAKPKPSRFMRQAITEAVERTLCPKAYVTINVKLTNTDYYDREFGVHTTLTNSFKDAVVPFFEAVERLQREIDRMNGRANL